MSSTIVHSNEEDSKGAVISGSEMYVTNESLEIPEQAQKPYEIITEYVEESGNIEVPTQNYDKCRDDNKETMVTVSEDGKLLQKTSRKLTQKEVEYIVALHPELINVLAKGKANAGKEAEK